MAQHRSSDRDSHHDKAEDDGGGAPHERSPLVRWSRHYRSVVQADLSGTAPALSKRTIVERCSNSRSVRRPGVAEHSGGVLKVREHLHDSSHHKSYGYLVFPMHRERRIRGDAPNAHNIEDQSSALARPRSP